MTVQCTVYNTRGKNVHNEEQRTQECADAHGYGVIRHGCAWLRNVLNEPDKRQVAQKGNGWAISIGSNVHQLNTARRGTDSS